jgi:nucleoside-specific outer membrane channel protein Tsx
MPLNADAEDFAKPTKFHEAMAYEVGTWDAEVSMWMSPDAEPMKSKAIEKNDLLGKMWLMSQFEGEFGGEKFMGRSALGYDPVKKKYVGGWVDSMSPFMMRMEGDYDAASQTLTMMGEGTDVMTGKPTKHKLVTQYEDEDAKTFTMYQQDGGDDGEWQKMMEINYTRRK